MALRVLYEDAHGLCVDKPPRPFTTPAAGQRAPALFNAVRRLKLRATHHHPLSRLDADVTGVVLFALTAEAVALAEPERAAGRYERSYVGLVTPAPTPAEGAWTWPVAVDHRDPRKRTAGAGADPQRAETRYVVEEMAGEHQIRVHARAAGTPLLGDGAYGGAKGVVLDDGAVVAAGRVMLHAQRARAGELAGGGAASRRYARAVGSVRGRVSAAALRVGERRLERRRVGRAALGVPPRGEAEAAAPRAADARRVDAAVRVLDDEDTAVAGALDFKPGAREERARRVGSLDALDEAAAGDVDAA